MALNDHDFIQDKDVNPYVRLHVRLNGVIAEIDYNEFLTSNLTRGIKTIGLYAIPDTEANETSAEPVSPARIEEIDEEAEVEESVRFRDEDGGSERDDDSKLLRAPRMMDVEKFENQEKIATLEGAEKRPKKKAKKNKAKKKKGKGKAAVEAEGQDAEEEQMRVDEEKLVEDQVMEVEPPEEAIAPAEDGRHLEDDAEEQPETVMEQAEVDDDTSQAYFVSSETIIAPTIIPPPTILITADPGDEEYAPLMLEPIPEEEEDPTERLAIHTLPEPLKSVVDQEENIKNHNSTSTALSAAAITLQIPQTPSMEDYEFEESVGPLSYDETPQEIVTPPDTPLRDTTVVNIEAEQELEDTSTETTPKADRFKSMLAIELSPPLMKVDTPSTPGKKIAWPGAQFTFGSIVPGDESGGSEEADKVVLPSTKSIPEEPSPVTIPALNPVPLSSPVITEIPIPERPLADMPALPSESDPHQLAHPWTLYYSCTSSSSSTNLGGVLASRGRSKGADEYSDGLFRIFTHSNLEELFGSWKALRRRIATKKSRPIEAQGNRLAPGMEGLGMQFMGEESSFHFFKDGVKPMWEDPMCARGGKIMMMGNLIQVSLSSHVLDFSYDCGV